MSTARNRIEGAFDHTSSAKILEWSKDLYCQKAGVRRIIVFVAMEIMSASFSRFSRIGVISCVVLFATGLQLFAQQSPVYARNLARFSLGARLDDNVAQIALISDHPTLGYALLGGNSELVLSLSKIQNFDVISFLNDGATGTVTISTS